MAHEDEPIAALFRRLRDGDGREESFRAVFDRFYWPLFRFFEHRGFRAEECQDLIQETLFRVDRGMDHFREDCRWEHWVFRIAANTASKAVRRRTATKRAGDEVPLPEGDGDEGPVFTDGGRLDGTAEPLRRLLSKEARDQLARAIEGLPAQMRRCVRLRLIQGLDFDEIGAMLDLSPSTVKVHVFKARQRLRLELGDLMPTLPP